MRRYSGHSILLVDDDEPFLRSLADELELSLGIRVVAVGCAEAALGRLERASFSLLLTDVRMAGMDGVDLVAAARRLDPSISAVLMSAFGVDPRDRRLASVSPCVLLDKPLDLDEVVEVIRRELAARDDDKGGTSISLLPWMLLLPWVGSFLSLVGRGPAALPRAAVEN